MLTIETRPIARLIPYVRNARTHSGDQIAQIAGSIAEFGFVNPVLIGADDVIIAGHGRVLAADLASPIDVPAHDNSAMDGYAFAGSALHDGVATTLVVADTVYAGTPWAGTVGAGGVTVPPPPPPPHEERPPAARARAARRTGRRTEPVREEARRAFFMARPWFRVRGGPQRPALLPGQGCAPDPTAPSTFS